MRFPLLMICVSLTVFLAPAAYAVDAPRGQVPLDLAHILRGAFTEEHQAKDAQAPLESTGHFVVAPAHGLIWGIEQPFPTSTVITADKAIQDVGGIALKLSAKNIRHLYDIVGRALAADWGGLEEDFAITPGGNGTHWQMVLVPRPTGKAALAYARITISGSRFVENIVMTKTDGSYDTLDFTHAVMAPAALTAQESALYAEAGR